MHKSKRLELWYTILMMLGLNNLWLLHWAKPTHQFSRGKICSQVLGLIGWNNCRHILAGRLPWGVNGTCSHPLDFSVHPPPRTRPAEAGELIAGNVAVVFAGDKTNMVQIYSEFPSCRRVALYQFWLKLDDSSLHKVRKLRKCSSKPR